MHATCLHCTKALGTNDVLETLPIGRRIAFDAATGRLWVVCRHCARWNLVPFESRLETIDAGERLFHDTRTRFSTDNIGLARLPEGLELVRIGPALRPEFAAWRYGDSFGKRRRRNIVMATGGVVAVLGVMAGAAALGASVAVLGQAPNWWNIAVNSRRTVIRVPREGATPIEMTPMNVPTATIIPDEREGWALRTQLRQDRVLRGFSRKSEVRHTFVGREATHLLAGVLGRVNGFAGSPAHVREAVQRVEGGGGGLREVLQQAKAIPAAKWASKPVQGLHPGVRLALEMSLNEETERKALEGELRLLEWQWREADRLAKIADDLLLEPEGEA